MTPRPLFFLALAATGILAGCGGSPESAAPAVGFAQARQSTTPVTVTGDFNRSTLRRETGQPTSFALTEPGTGERLDVVAGPSVSVPANIDYCKSVTATGTYDPAAKQLNATYVEPKVPNREQQH